MGTNAESAKQDHQEKGEFCEKRWEELDLGVDQQQRRMLRVVWLPSTDNPWLQSDLRRSYGRERIIDTYTHQKKEKNQPAINEI